MTSRGVQTQLTEEQVREMREYAAGFVDQPRGLGTVTDRNAANVVALADAYLALKERLMVAWTEDEYFQDRERLLATLRAVNDNALSWHAGEDGKARALNVIAVWTSEALAGRVHPSVAAIEESRAAVSVGSPETRETEE